MFYIGCILSNTHIVWVNKMLLKYPYIVNVEQLVEANAINHVIIHPSLIGYSFFKDLFSCIYSTYINNVVIDFFTLNTKICIGNIQRYFQVRGLFYFMTCVVLVGVILLRIEPGYVSHKYTSFICCKAICCYNLLYSIMFSFRMWIIVCN